MKASVNILKREYLVPVQHGISNEEMFKDMITEIIKSEKFDITEINNSKRVFLCKKICYKGDHVGYSTKKKQSSWFTYKDHQNRYQSTHLFTVEYVEIP